MVRRCCSIARSVVFAVLQSAIVVDCRCGRWTNAGGRHELFHPFVSSLFEVWQPERALIRSVAAHSQPPASVSCVVILFLLRHRVTGSPGRLRVACRLLRKERPLDFFFQGKANRLGPAVRQGLLALFAGYDRGGPSLRLA